MKWERIGQFSPICFEIKRESEKKYVILLLYPHEYKRWKKIVGKNVKLVQKKWSMWGQLFFFFLR